MLEVPTALEGTELALTALDLEEAPSRLTVVEVLSGWGWTATGATWGASVLVVTLVLKGLVTATREALDVEPLIVKSITTSRRGLDHVTRLELHLGARCGLIVRAG